jgi:hypothetical protein
MAIALQMPGENRGMSAVFGSFAVACGAKIIRNSYDDSTDRFFPLS